MNEESLVYRLRKRAEIRRNIPHRKSVQEGEPDRISDLLEEAADYIEELDNKIIRKWISVLDQLPEIPEGKHGITVDVAFYCCEDEPNEVEEMIWDGENFLELMMGKGWSDFKPTYSSVHHWMYRPEPPDVSLDKILKIVNINRDECDEQIT